MGVRSLRRTDDLASPRAARSPGAMACKRAIDIVVAAAVIVLAAPVMALIALAILLLDGRPILFRQERVGRFGEVFTIYKFRTMVPDAHERLDEVAHTNQRTGPLFKATDDPRVTRVGRFLRRTSLDEFPQFFNVLMGTMSLVGPRPALPEERLHFPPELLRRERMPQGLTGLWQLEGRDDSDFEVYRDLDLAYVDSWSLWRDVRILVRTPLVVAQQAIRRTVPNPDAADDLVDPQPIRRSTTPRVASPAYSGARSVRRQLAPALSATSDAPSS